MKSAFLNGGLEETVYVSQSEGFVKENKNYMVYGLVKLYIDYDKHHVLGTRYRASVWRSLD